MAKIMAAKGEHQAKCVKDGENGAMK